MALTNTMADDSTGVTEPTKCEEDSEILPSAPDVAPGYIKPIDRGSVHKICSGQVVLTLATAVKELVENSVDAGATSVEIKLKEYGSEMIEVIDNGSGVKESNFEGLTLKHHTSKIQDFSDLINVETFGFRGEALSSLCALSQLSATTRHKSVSVGHRMDFDNHGKLTNKSPCARQIGTTVTLQNLFSTLPVRHKEFQRHLKKEFSKMIQVLNAYCIISKGVRLSCSNQNGKGKRNIVVSTNGNSSLRENISNIFGPKQLQSLLEFKQIHPADEICEELGLKIPEKFHIMYKVSGFVSSCRHGQGRSSTDRQFYFINQRPCDPTKVSKVVNEVYHTYNRHQYPFVALDIQLEKEHVDVNVTPDKRQIFVQEEKLLLAIIKSSLIKMFEPIHAVYQINSVPTSAAGQLTSMFKKLDSPEVNGEQNEGSVENTKPELNKRKSSIVSTLANLKRSFSSAFSRDEEKDNAGSSPQKQTAKQRRLDGFVNLSMSPGLRSRTSSSPKSCESSLISDRLTPDESGFCSSQDLGSAGSQSSIESPKLYKIITHMTKPEESTSSSSENIDCCMIDDDNLQDSNQTSTNGVKEAFAFSVCSETEISPCESVGSCRIIDEKLTEEPLSIPEYVKPDTQSLDHSVNEMTVLAEISSSSQDQPSREITGTETTCSLEESNTESAEDLKVTLMKYDNPDNIKKKETKVSFSMKRLKDKFANRNTAEKHDEFCRRFRAKISPTDNQSAEEELQKEIKKEMFAEMEILGQFNLGFIIARLKDDLFIIDQHATDEKFNFEMLQKNTVIQSQRLIQPLPLELTASNEIILMDNIDIFKKNGFDFAIDENANPTQRIKLTSTPMSKNWTFGKEDIEEMLFMLSESPGVSCRPSRVRQMFASRSCRKAVMIGTALDTAEMRKLVQHMGEIEQPWNCPHGRPTMRHLINLRMIQR